MRAATEPTDLEAVAAASTWRDAIRALHAVHLRMRSREASLRSLHPESWSPRVAAAAVKDYVDDVRAIGVVLEIVERDLRLIDAATAEWLTRVAAELKEAKRTGGKEGGD